MNPFLKSLPFRQREIASLVFTHGEMTAVEVERGLDAPVGNAAVRSLLRCLEAKGVLRRRLDGKRFIYLPAGSEAEMRKAMLLRVASDHYGGSIEKMVGEARHLALAG